MPIMVSMCQHFAEQQFRNTVMCSCAPYTIFCSSKVRFMHTSTVRSHSCSEKTTRMPVVQECLLPRHSPIKRNVICFHIILTKLQCKLGVNFVYLQVHFSIGLHRHAILAVAYLGFHFGGGSKFFWKSGGICMVRSAMQRVAKPRVC